MKRYKLLKDLPELPIGTEFVQIEEGYFRDYLAPAHVVDGDHIEEHDERCLIRSEHAANNPDWFQPVTDTPERPYPWLPDLRYQAERATVRVSAFHETYKDSSDIGSVLEYFRTKEDAELRLKAEPLVNAAVKALINGRTPPNMNGGARYWIVTVSRGGEFSPLEAGWVGEAVSRKGRYGKFYTEQDAQAVADLFNFFISTSA